MRSLVPRPTPFSIAHTTKECGTFNHMCDVNGRQNIIERG